MKEDLLHDGLGARARDQHAAVDVVAQPEEPGLTDEVLHGLVLERAGDQVAELLAFDG